MRTKSFLLIFMLLVSLNIGCSKGGDSIFIQKKYPIMFVHGIGGVSTFQTIREGFNSRGYSKEYLKQAFLPKIGVQGAFFQDSNPSDYSNYGPFNIALWDTTGNTVSNVNALKEQIENLLLDTGANKIDIIAHSNGTTVTRLLLAHKYPEIAEKIRKVVFISGYADVSGCTEGSTVCRYLNATTSNMPEKIDYHAISSDSDAIYDDVQARDAGGNETRFFKEEIGTNHKLIGHDHLMAATSFKAFKAAYKAITGKCAFLKAKKSKVKIAGFVKIATNYVPNIYNPQQYVATKQIFYSNAKVKIEYYDDKTGKVIKTITENPLITDVNGQWGPIKVSSKNKLKITITKADDSASTVYFFAQKIKQNNYNLEFSAPTASVYPAGSMMILNASFAEYYNRQAYENVSATNLDATIQYLNTDGSIAKTIELDETHSINQYSPETRPLFWSTHTAFTNLHQNILTDYGQSFYGFDTLLTEAMDVLFTAKMTNADGKELSNTIRINSNDLSQNRLNYLFYLYPNMDN